MALVLSLGSNSAFSALGVFYAVLPAVALVWLRSDPTLGLSAILYLLVIVAVSDTAGFLFGRLIGGAKLWPRLSPNKTWSGTLGGVAAAAEQALRRDERPQITAARIEPQRKRLAGRDEHLMDVFITCELIPREICIQKDEP